MDTHKCFVKPNNKRIFHVIFICGCSILFLYFVSPLHMSAMPLAKVINKEDEQLRKFYCIGASESFQKGRRIQKNAIGF